MLKRIEIWNFESHKHTVIDDLSEQLNLIKGESNAGKSSILRAIQLVAYNIFDPKSVRVGEKKCEVKVTTERGSVKVTRGAGTNIWEVTPIGENPMIFDKVGKQVVPEAARIIGMNMIKLGDMDIPINIMNQLESHFMLASVSGQDASGSLRAQIIDEISGLSGIEGVIKEVSLDNHRNGRGIKEAEDKMEETREQLHDEKVIAEEGVVLSEAEQVLIDHDNYERASSDARAILESWNKDVIESNSFEDTLNAMPDVDAANGCIAEAEQLAQSKKAAKELQVTANSVQQRVKELTEKLSSIPDVKKVSVLIASGDKSMMSSAAVKKLNSEYQSVKSMIDRANVKLKEFAKVKNPTEILAKAEETRGRLAEAEALMAEVQAIMDDMLEVDEKLKGVEVGLEKAIKDRDVILASIKVCPLTLKPVSRECLKGEK